MNFNYFKDYFLIKEIKDKLKNNSSFIVGRYKDGALYLFCMSFKVRPDGKRFVEYKGFRIFDNLNEKRFRKVYDRIIENAKKNKSKDPFAYLDELVDLLAKGDGAVLQEYRRVSKILDGGNFDEIGTQVFKRKKRRISLKIFLLRYNVLQKNKARGEAFELIFMALKGGIKPPAIIFGKRSRRFVDNLIELGDNIIARELKSGRIKLTSSIKRQINKDFNILTAGRRDIDKIEWHTIEGVDDKVLDFILTGLKKRMLPKESFKIIIYD